jgi:hypothetical protein
MGDLTRMQAKLDPPAMDAERFTLEGEAAFAPFSGYIEDFLAATHGKGTLNYRLDHYAPCRDAEAIIAAAAYNPLAVGTAKYYEVEKGHPTLASGGGFLYDNTYTHLYYVPSFDEYKQDLYIPRNVKTTSGQPFETKWLRVWLPESLEAIDARWIDGNDLRDVYCPAATPPVFLQQNEESPLHSNNMNYHAKLHVLPGCAEAYKAAPGWCDIRTVL